MAYRRSGSYRARASAGYSRGRSSGFVGRAAPRRRSPSTRRTVKRAPAARQQVVRLVIEQAPASGISRANDRVLKKMNPAPGKAKM